MSNTKKAFLLNAQTQKIEKIEIANLADMQKAVGGYITHAHQLPNGDDIFVDDEGLLKIEGPAGMHNGFAITGAGQDWYAGNGLVIGHDTRTGDSEDAESTLAQLTRWVAFKSLIKF